MNPESAAHRHGARLSTDGRSYSLSAEDFDRLVLTLQRDAYKEVIALMEFGCTGMALQVKVRSMLQGVIA
ncbi:MAG: hypothetical protein V4636_12985 [Pseudomonadota bacterium]